MSRDAAADVELAFSELRTSVPGRGESERFVVQEFFDGERIV